MNFLILIKVIILFFIVPELLGALLTKYIKEKYNFYWNFVLGYLIEFAILELISIPMIFCRISFNVLAYTWEIIIGILCVVSIIFNIKNIVNYFKEKNFLKYKFGFLTFSSIIIVLFQISMSIILTHYDEDDAFFIGIANVMLTENSMYIISAETGEAYDTFPARYVLSPFPVYTAINSKILKMIPTIVSHSLFSPVFIGLAYILYLVIALKLFNDNKNKTSLFIIILSIIYIFGNYSIYSNFSFLLFRIWQGKAILANIIIPAIFIIFFKCIEDENNFINWIILSITGLAGCFVSSMGVGLIPIEIALLSMVYAIKERKISYLIKSCVCMLPIIILAVIYLFIR